MLKATEEYINIILTAVKRKWTRKYCKENNIYVEEHHILPKSLFPEMKLEKAIKVLLTGQEHYIVHRELAKANPDNIKLVYAWNAMCTKNKNTPRPDIIISPEEYEEARIKAGQATTIRQTGMKRPKSEEAIKHLSESLKGKKHNITPEGRAAIAKSVGDRKRGVPMSEEQKRKISETQKGKPQPWNHGGDPELLRKLAHANRKPVRDKITGIIYVDKKTAAQNAGVTLGSIRYDIDNNVNKRWEHVKEN